MTYYTTGGRTMIEKLRKTGAYVIISIGFYICACLALLLLNFVQSGLFDNILVDGFKVAFVAGIILLVVQFLKKRK